MFVSAGYVATGTNAVEIARRFANERSTLASGVKGFCCMANVTIVYWRDIPSMVRIGKGRRAAKASLPERFEQAIDRCAMKIGAKGDDAYMAEWREADGGPVEGDAQEVANATAARLEAEYDADRIRVLIANEGWATPAS